MTRTFKIWLAALLGLALVTAAPLPAAAQVTIPSLAKPHDAAKVAIAFEILDNLQTLTIATRAGQRALLADPLIVQLPPADKTLLSQLFAEEMARRHDEMITAMAGDNVDRFSIDQLNDILTFSRIPYVQAVCLRASDPTLAVPDPNSMTAQQRRDFANLGDAPYTADFLGNFNFSSESTVVAEAASSAVQRYVALKSGKGG
ncbi:MAG: hypothetical protein WDN06_14630 [Asticcacaulis sp.]